MRNSREAVTRPPWRQWRLDRIKELEDLKASIKLPDKPKPKKKDDDISIVQRVLDPLGYTRIKAPYEK